MAVNQSTNVPELALTRRYLVLSLLVLPLLLALMAFARQQSNVPSWPSSIKEEVQRGAIISSDGVILAEGTAAHRRYPQGTLAAHLIGFSGAEQPDGRYGLEGLEFSMDNVLQQGEDVRLTINAQLQAVAQAELRKSAEKYDAENGAVVMLEAGTGRILAAASYPDFNPSRQGNVQNREDISNKAFLRQVEPGSVMKPFVVASLLESGRLSPDELIEADMSLRVGDKTFHDVAQHEKVLTIPDILAYSSNVGMIHLSERFSHQELNTWLSYFGFGQDVGLHSIYTRTGYLPNWSTWVPQDHASITIGQGVSTTALQLAAAYSIFANNGYYVTPKLLENEVTEEPRRVISPEVAMTIRSMLEYTVNNSGIAKSKIPDVTMAGKTGTADIYDAAAGRYIPGDYTLTFAGMFPADKPKVIMVVYLQKPKLSDSSTYVAAPLFRDIGSEVVALWGMTPPVSTYVSAP